MIPDHAYWIRVSRFSGDAMMVYAAIEPLRRAKLPLVVWGPEHIVDLFAGSAGITAVMPEPLRKYGVWQASRMLRRHRPAAVIGFPHSMRPHLASWLARVPIRLGCGDRGARFLQTHSVAFFSTMDHHVERFFPGVAQAFPELGPLGFTPYRPREEAFARRESQARELGFFGAYVVMAPGSTFPSKRLGIHHFVALGRRFEALGLRVVILGVGAEEQRVASLLTAELPNALNLVDRCPLSLTAAWICDARAMVGNDSGLSHIAGAAGIPTLVVFGPTLPNITRPWGPLVKVARNESLTCLQCLNKVCPLPDHPCMNDLDDSVLWHYLTTLMESK
jgi:heptosyltransferase-2